MEWEIVVDLRQNNHNNAQSCNRRAFAGTMCRQLSNIVWVEKCRALQSLHTHGNHEVGANSCIHTSSDQQSHMFRREWVSGWQRWVEPMTKRTSRLIFHLCPKSPFCLFYYVWIYMFEKEWRLLEKCGPPECLKSISKILITFPRDSCQWRISNSKLTKWPPPISLPSSHVQVNQLAAIPRTFVRR